MKFAIHDARTWNLLNDAQDPVWICASFFFHDRGSDIQKTLTGMLQEVAGSILRQLPQLLFCVKAEYMKRAQIQKTRRPKWDLASLKSVLFGMVEQRQVLVKLVIFLDALDEHAGDNDELAQILKTMSRKADNESVVLKICLASRSWNVFEHHFSAFRGLTIHEHTKGDIYAYTRTELESSKHGFPDLLRSEHLEMLTQQITSKALGVFIWVRLVVDQLAKDIRDGTPYLMLVERVAQMPQELKKLYEDILRRLGAHLQHLISYIYETLRASCSAFDWSDDIPFPSSATRSRLPRLSLGLAWRTKL